MSNLENNSEYEVIEFDEDLDFDDEVLFDDDLEDIDFFSDDEDEDE